MVVGSVGVSAQGSETFETQTALTASYANGTFTSETTGVTVNYVHSRNEGLQTTDDYSINGKGIMLRRADEPSSVEFVIPSGGVGTFTFKYRKAFTGGTNNRILALVVDGAEVFVTPTFGAAGADATIHNFSFDVNKAGSVNVKITYPAGTGTGNKQITIDDVSWTGYTSTTPVVVNPVITPSTGTYYSPQTVSISTETTDAVIRYTIDGSEPDEISTQYTTPISVSTTTTVKARAYKAGMEPSAIVSAVYTFPTIIEVSNIAAFLATTETGNVIISGPVTVVYQNGQNLYVQDSSGSLLVYGNLGKTFTNGDQLTGLMGTLGTYGQSPQMTSPTAPDAVSGTEVSPIVFDLGDVAVADLAKYVKVENVQFAADVAFSTDKTINGTLTNPSGFTVRDNFRLGGTYTAGKNYDIIGFISYYNGTAQLFPVTITEVATTTPTITVSSEIVDFGSVEVGTTSDAKTVTVIGTNLTTAPSISPVSSEFTITGTLTVEGGTLTITYTPAAASASTGTITITGDGQTATVTLTGSGAMPPLTKPVATDATGISQTGFTANWNAVSGAESYKLNVYTKTDGGNASDLFISEYIEGSSYNKAIEIFNGTGSVVDLSSYSIMKQVNGAGEYGSELTLSGTLANNDVYVIAYVSGENAASSDILAVTDLQTSSSAINYNGNDAVALFKNSVKIDEVGVFNQVTPDWGKDLTLVRKSTTVSPKATYDAEDWDVYEKDYVTNLGSHTMNSSSKTPITGSPFTTTSTSQAVSGLANTGIYFYTVIAVRGTEESPLSNEIGPISLTATGLSNTKVDALAWTSSGKVMLNASAGEVIEIFNVAGQKVVSRPAVDGLNSVDVSAKGVVIVKVNNRISKVIL